MPSADRNPRRKPVARGGVSGFLHRPATYRTILLVAVLIVVQHLVAHAGFRPLPLSMGWQDVLVGYPFGAIVGFVGLILWGSDPTPR